jgi:RNA polymerase sigma-70 factor (ECF subfamily)
MVRVKTDAAAPPAARGDAGPAWEDVFASYERTLRAVLARLCPGESQARLDDIRQNARLRLWRSLQSEREIRNPSSYMYRIAVSATLDALRAHKALREETLADEALSGGDAAQPSPEEVADRRERVARVGRALASLPERRRRCVALHLQGLTTQEIGDLLGWSEAKARNLLYRGLADLRARLEEDDG